MKKSKDVPGEFIRIPLVYAEEVWLPLSYEDLADKMKIRAAKVRANGPILGGLEQKLDVSGSGESASIHSDKIMKAVAIYVKK